MEKLSSLFGRLALTVAGALALGACNRSEYAMLPKSASYLGTKSTAYTPRPAALAPIAATPAPVAPEVTATPAVAEPAAAQSVATPRLPTPAAPAKVVAAKPAPEATATPAPAVAAAPATQPKLSLVQRLMLNKLVRKIDRQTEKMSVRKSDNTASTARVDGKLRYAIIFGAISLIFFIIGGGLANTIGTILLVIAVLFLLFWLLDNL